MRCDAALITMSQNRAKSAKKVHYNGTKMAKNSFVSLYLLLFLLYSIHPIQSIGARGPIGGPRGPAGGPGVPKKGTGKMVD